MPEPGRRPLKPLPPQLGGPVRQFTEQLRAVYRDRTELNQRELAEALHLTKSPVSRYLNGQEVVPADTFEALCGIAGLTPRERERLGRLRERAAEAAERARNAPEEQAANAPVRDGASATGEAEDPAAVRPRRPAALVLPRHLAAKLRSPAGLGALAAVAVLCAGTFAVVAWDGSGTPDASHAPGNSANLATDRQDRGPSCRTTRVYRVIEDGDILDARHNDIGDVRADDVFRLDTAPAGRPYRFRDYGHVAGSHTKGYVDQAKLKALGSRCVGEGG
ncbi:helix-turn-helix domain-containing protein [Streptomyces winkii]|uniref:helix-turn-helix domain-containing protein n=1 Tax=Streptomyces winkii TaxID=3051178 RepID=UPI0028D1B963|nr:helix-turn-helix transcriptional regulator [Streptomyces sp. DSM 40971]